MTIYDFIDRNNRNTLLLILLFPIALCIIVFVLTLIALLLFDTDGDLIFTGAAIADAMHIGLFDIKENTPYIQAVLMASTGFTLLCTVPIFAICAIWMFFAYYCGSGIILTAAAANPVRKSDNPEIYRLVENVAIAAGLPTPKLYIIADKSLNAFATGRDVNHASITLTTGLIKKLDRQELEAVIAHEMAHIGNRDIRLMIIIIIGIGILTFLADVLFRVLYRVPRSSNGKGGAGIIYMLIIIMAISLALFSFLVAPLLKFAISRSQEYQADATSAIITRNPGALARALEKISMDSRVEVLDNMPSIGALCIANPLGYNKQRLFDKLSGLYATHPPIEQRIQALRKMDSM